MFGLKWSDKVDLPELGDGVFVFVLNRTKNSHSRAVVCNSIARRAVETQRQWQEKHVKSEFVFPSRANGHAGNRVRSAGKVWSEAWKRAGLPTDRLTKAGIHNMRHTFGYRLRQAGVAAEDREALLGHANNNLAQHYAVPDIKRLLEAAELATIRNDTVVIRSAHDPNAYRR
jgi:integrase